jgi:hypothetical protein
LVTKARPWRSTLATATAGATKRPRRKAAPELKIFTNQDLIRSTYSRFIQRAARLRAAAHERSAQLGDPPRAVIVVWLYTLPPTCRKLGASNIMSGVNAVIDVLRSLVFILCELVVLLMVFSPFLLKTDENGTSSFKPFGTAWIIFGIACGAFLMSALFAPI